MSPLLALLPSDYAVLLFMAAGFALIVQAKQLAAGLALAGCGMIILPALSAPFLAILPGWVRWVIAVIVGLSIARSVLRASVGRATSDHVVGTLAADAIRFCLLLPFRLIGVLFTALFGGRIR